MSDRLMYHGRSLSRLMENHSPTPYFRTPAGTFRHSRHNSHSDDSSISSSPAGIPSNDDVFLSRVDGRNLSCHSSSSTQDQDHSRTSLSFITGGTSGPRVSDGLHSSGLSLSGNGRSRTLGLSFGSPTPGRTRLSNTPALDHHEIIGTSTDTVNNLSAGSTEGGTLTLGSILGKRSLPSDMEQTVRAVSRKINLKADSEKELKKFASASEEEQRIWIYGSLLQLRETCSEIEPADAAYTIPEKLLTALRAAVVKTILDPGLPGYLKSPSVLTRVTAHLVADTSSGYSNIKNDTTKNGAVMSRVRTALDRQRSDIKKFIHASFGSGAEHQDVLQLSEAIVAKIAHGTQMTVTLPFVARVAFLRKVYGDNRNAEGVCATKYWGEVDKELMELRKLPDAETISKKFQDILDKDLHTYGDADLEDLVMID